jgi:perosamine synthetase
MIPYSRQFIDQDDIDAVVDVLRSDWLTTGPKVTEFEEAFADSVGVDCAVAVNSGTAALHAAMFALGIEPGDEVVVPPVTFSATANCVVFQGGTPVFADVEPDTLLIDPVKVQEKITERTKAIIAVDFTGQPCDYEQLWDVAARHGLKLVADGCHALGAEYKGKSVGSLADMTVFSFHPVKHITTGEGGMVTADDLELAHRMRIFRNHGITTDFKQREEQGSWFYEMVDLGYNYRITDIQCALGLSQLKKLPHFLERRREIARLYDTAYSKMEGVTPLAVRNNVLHAYHLYVLRIDFQSLGTSRLAFFRKLRERGIGVNVHYIPLHLHPFYRERFGTGKGQCPFAESAYKEILSLPMFPAMSDSEVKQVIASVQELVA